MCYSPGYRQIGDRRPNFHRSMSMSPHRVVTPQHYLHLRFHAPVNVAPLIVNETRRKRSNAVSLFLSFMENIYLLTKNGLTRIAIG